MTKGPTSEADLLRQAASIAQVIATLLELTSREESAYLIRLLALYLLLLAVLSDEDQ